MKSSIKDIWSIRYEDHANTSRTYWLRYMTNFHEDEYLNARRNLRKRSRAENDPVLHDGKSRCIVPVSEKLEKLIRLE